MLQTFSRDDNLDLSDMESILAKGLDFNTVISTIVYDYSTMIVNSAGLPMAYSAHLPAIFKVGEVWNVSSRTIEGVHHG